MCCGVSTMTSNTRWMNSVGTRACHKSDMLFTNTVRGVRHRFGRLSAPGWTAKPKPGPLVRGSPSCWYFGLPMAFNRLASVSA